MLDRNNLLSYQREIVEHVKAGSESLLLVEVGLGKTVSTLTALADMMREDWRDLKKRRRALIVAPKMVAENVWRQETQKWAHLTHLKVGVASGRSAALRKKLLTDPSLDVVCINYDLLPWLMQAFPRHRLGELFYFLVMDEIDKMKDPGTKRFRRFRTRADEFEVRIGMTGTLVSESIENAWGPSYLVTLGKALGSSHQRFRRQYFEPIDYQGWKWAPRPGAIEAVAQRLDPFSYRARARDYLDLPPIIYADRHFDLPKKARDLYEQFERDMLLMLQRGHLDLDMLIDPEESESDDWETEVEAANAAVLKNKLRQICSGFTYHQEPGQELRKTFWLHKAKLDAVKDLRGELDDAQLMIVYGFKAEYENVKLDGRLGGNVPGALKTKYMQDWNAGKLRTLGMHPASAGHGVNLQESGAHHIAFMTLPWSRSLYDQTIGRLHRMGQKNAVIVHRFIANDTVEQDVLRALENKGSIQEQVVEAIKGRVKRG